MPQRAAGRKVGKKKSKEKAAAVSASTVANTAGAAGAAPKPPGDYNPRWKGYSYIFLASLINFTAIQNINERDEDHVQGSWGVSLSFGIVLFVYSLSVLVTDRLPITSANNSKLPSLLNYPKAWDGKLEGCCLLIATLYSLVGVAYITQVRGIAYTALNVYVTAWLSAAACVYTLNQWSTAKDILSIQELTGVSATLKSWYIVFLASMVVTGTSINMLAVLGEYPSSTDSSSGSGSSSSSNSNTLQIDNARAASFGIAFGLCSTIISLWFILSHYNLIECTTEGGCFELSCILVVVLLWIVGTAVLTQDGGIAATIVGSGCQLQPHQQPSNQEQQMLTKLMDDAAQQAAADPNGEAADDCVLIIQNVTYACKDVWNFTASGDAEAASADSALDGLIPGSNLYVSVWICLLASFNLASRWKAQQALQFAQARQENASSATTTTSPQQHDGAGTREATPRSGGNGDDVESSDGGLDLEEFEDADDF